MKKIFSLTVSVVMIFTAVLFSGCTGTKEAELSAVLQDINSRYSSATSGLTQLEEVSDLDKYYEISKEDVKQFAAEINADASTAPVEIVMVEAKDSQGADDIEQKLNNRYQTIYSQYASYSAEQLKMAKKCSVTRAGNYVVLIVAQDYDGMIEIVNSAIK